MNSNKELNPHENHDNAQQQEVINTAMEEFCAMMNNAGPVVRALLLKADGSVLEIDYDSTPMNNHISKILGGSPTILGELPGQVDGVILTKKRTPDLRVDLPNKHAVVAPYGEVFGDVFVTRLDEHVCPQHFGLSEFESWKSVQHNSSAERDGCTVNVGTKKNVNLDDEEEFDYELENGAVEDFDLDAKEEFDYEAEDSDKDENDPGNAAMHSEINEQISNCGGKVRTAEQVKSVLDHLGFNVVGDLSAEEERKLLAEAYMAEHGKKPSVEQLDNLMEILPRVKAAPFLYEDFPEVDEEDDIWVPPEANDEESMINRDAQDTFLSKGGLRGRCVDSRRTKPSIQKNSAEKKSIGSNTESHDKIMVNTKNGDISNRVFIAGGGLQEITEDTEMKDP